MAKKANMKQNDTAPAELRKLAVQAVKHKATIDDANFKKRELRETLVRLQEALEERRAEERRIAEEARRREEEQTVVASATTLCGVTEPWEPGRCAGEVTTPLWSRQG